MPSRPGLLLILLLCLPSRQINSQEVGEEPGRFPVADSLEMFLQLHYDSLGLPHNYYSRVLTPVCETGKCYVIELMIYWDLAGGFAGYDTLPGKPLTKLDHIPFTPSDYRKLRDILQDEHSALGLYGHDELVLEHKRSSRIDGFTGATVDGIRESVIGGAVYSCHTLWNIVHGPAVDTIRAATLGILSPSLVEMMFKTGNPGYRAFLTGNFRDEDFISYLPLVLNSILEGEGPEAREVVEAVPDWILGDPRAQTFFTARFTRFDYFTQVSLLEKLSPSSLDPDFRQVLEESLTTRNSYRNELIKKLLKGGL